MEPKPRDIKTLLLLVLANLDWYIEHYAGLCIMYAVMMKVNLITEEEYDLLYFYTIEHRPAQIDDNDGYFWPMYDIKQRRDFIENLISKL